MPGTSNARSARPHRHTTLIPSSPPLYAPSDAEPKIKDLEEDRGARYAVWASNRPLRGRFVARAAGDQRVAQVCSARPGAGEQDGQRLGAAKELQDRLSQVGGKPHLQ
jgi:hypothetical protein